MVEIRRSTVIDAPLAQLWSILRDFNGHEAWHPTVTRSAIEDGAPSDMVGAVRDFRLADGGRIREQLLALSDENCSFSYCILEAPVPLIGYVAHVRLRPVTDGEQTFWEWRSRFTCPPGVEREMRHLVAEQIYAAGFQAIGKSLRGLPVRAPARAPIAVRAPAPVSPPRPDETQAVVIESHGGPEVLRLRNIPIERPGPGEVRIRQRAVGVNYIDVYTRTGYFDLVRPPGVPGMEAAGVIESTGKGVVDWRIGDRVAYACAPPGAYAALRVMKPDLLVQPPDFLSDEQMAASLLKGITASFLLHDVYALREGDTILVHAAAGGVGLLLCQWASALGARVIGTTSNAAKAERAAAAGCAHVINYRQQDFAEEVLGLTNGRGVDAVYDAVGRDTFEKSIESLKIRGTLVSFGQASGDIGLYEVGRLAGKSLTLSRPNYGHYTATQEDVSRQARRFFQAVADGLVHIGQPRTFPLSQAASAHAALEDRTVIGSVVLLP
ncbi:zinc-binding dehydrogenase [Aestuariivirga sp.]|uniref:zinc-binding dehydrogenase n=1 Tax=Aestuariivirga sp. TaxID=2650926 RepID=UPI003BA8DF52